MNLRSIEIERYKGYAERAVLELAPLTVIVGPNNSGKTALARAIQLLAGGLAPPSDAAEPLPLESGGIRHADSFEDLVTGRAIHGRLDLSARFASDDNELTLAIGVQNVVAPTRAAERQILRWHLESDGASVAVERQGLGEADEYEVSASGSAPFEQGIVWQGLVPDQPQALASWAGAEIEALSAWAQGIRYLRSPRNLGKSPFLTPEKAPRSVGANGQQTPLALAADDQLRAAVRDWYGAAFGAKLDIVPQGKYSEFVVRTPASKASVLLAQSGQGLSHVLPVVVTALTAGKAGPGVDVIEHPEAELHPAAHVEIAELLLDNLVGPARPLVVETHSEMLLLRARRWVAEKRLPPESVLVYWVHTEPGRGSILRQIKMNERGEMADWPDGVFIEAYEEIIAIRRGGRSGT